MSNSGPHDLTEVRAILDFSGLIETKLVSPDFYQELGDFTGKYLVSCFSFSEPWGVWEMHPAGDEWVYLLSGDTDMVLHDGERETAVIRVSEPGTFVIVPKGMWHTANPYQPTSMLFVTPGEGTLNAKTPGGTPL